MTEKLGRVSLVVRLPADIHGAATALAKQDERSLNWLIIAALKERIANAQTVGDTRAGSG